LVKCSSTVSSTCNLNCWFFARSSALHQLFILLFLLSIFGLSKHIFLAPRSSQISFFNFHGLLCFTNSLFFEKSEQLLRPVSSSSGVQYVALWVVVVVGHVMSERTRGFYLLLIWSLTHQATSFCL
jgi:hypothetical protein